MNSLKFGLFEQQELLGNALEEEIWLLHIKITFLFT
jgi:hypothetical protein